MKWIILIAFLLTQVSSAQDKCRVMEFYNIAYKIHNPSERHQQMSAWLTNNRGFCSSNSMVVIWNNLSEWAGAADSAELRHKIIHEYKDAVKRETK